MLLLLPLLLLLECCYSRGRCCTMAHHAPATLPQALLTACSKAWSRSVDAQACAAEGASRLTRRVVQACEAMGDDCVVRGGGRRAGTMTADGVAVCLPNPKTLTPLPLTPLPLNPLP